MRVFIRVQVASILGSAADYAATILLTEIFRCPYLISNFLGNILGGTAQFNLCKHWAFKDTDGKMPVQAMRFITHFVGLNYIVSKTITSIGLGLTYNYWMQKKYVFA
jgi:putative flippase GtrA